MIRDSRYARTTAAFIDDVLELDDRQMVSASNGSNGVPHVVVDGDTPWSIAERYFGGMLTDAPSMLYWAVLDSQPGEPIIDPLLPLEPGRLLIIPSTRRMAAILAGGSR